MSITEIEGGIENGVWNGVANGLFNHNIVILVCVPQAVK